MWPIGPYKTSSSRISLFLASRNKQPNTSRLGRPAVYDPETVAATVDVIRAVAPALHWDDYRDDDFRRLHYLSLW